jgi:hypothetical protein
LGGSDAHLPRQFGMTYSLVDTTPEPESVLSAIHAGRVRVVSQPLATSPLCAIGLALMGGTILQAGCGILRGLCDGARLRIESVSPRLRKSDSACTRSIKS